MKSLLTRLYRDESGAMAVETIIIIALIALPIIIGLALFRHTIQGWFASWAGQVADQNNQGNLP